MRGNTVLTRGVLFFALSVFLFAGCKKEPTNAITDVDDNGGYAYDASRVEWMSNDAMSIADAAGNYYNGVYMRTTNTFGTCATVSTDTLSSPHVLIVRFGDQNCKCLDGRTRRGTILISYDGHYTTDGLVRSLTFQDYYVNDWKMEGSIKYTRVDTTVIGKWFYNVKVDETITTAPNKFITWKGNLTRKWITGFETPDRDDDVFSISGGASLTRANGHLFSFDIQTPMQFAMNCDYCEAGVVNITGYNGTRQLDYSPSSGTTINDCDNVAKLTMNSHVYTVKFNKQ